MATYLPVRAISRSQAVRIGKTNLSKESITTGLATYYVNLEPTGGEHKAYSELKELKQHLAIGAVIVVGPLTFTNEDWVVSAGLNFTKAKGAEGESTEIIVAAGELRQRSTGKTVVVATKTETITEPGATKEKISLVRVKQSNGVISKQESADAAKGAAVEPTHEEGYTYLVKVVAYNKNATNVITDIRPVQ